MASTMASPVSLGRPDWQQGHIPRLSYRNPLPPGEGPSEKASKADPSPSRTPAGKGLSIKEIREALPREAVSISPQTVAPHTAMQVQKPKKSFLGGLFNKEPSMAALDQVAQQMMAQHGSISPKTIPHVSSKKMPDHVPKVNSKWDGVPDYVKMKEKEEREKTRNGVRNSIHLLNTKSFGTEAADDQSVIRRRNSNTASNAESWDSRSTGSRPVFQDDYSARPESIYSSSSTTSGQIPSRSPPVCQGTTTIFTVSETSDIPVWIDGTSTPPHGPHRMLSAQSISTRSTASSNRSRLERPARGNLPSTESITDYSSSVATTPVERSPQSSVQFLDQGKGSKVSAPKASVFTAVVNPSQPAKPSVARRTSTSKSTNSARKGSRAGLGLTIGNPVAPWETQELPSETTKIQAENPLKSRAKGRIFGKEKR